MLDFSCLCYVVVTAGELTRILNCIDLIACNRGSFNLCCWQLYIRIFALFAAMHCFKMHYSSRAWQMITCASRHGLFYWYSRRLIARVSVTSIIQIVELGVCVRFN